MTAAELAAIVSQMRHAQTDYKRCASVSTFKEMQRLEKMVDRCCTIILDGQKELFPDDN